jgi:ectoine hydroxylase-related dioxygenase (phytanoyl-CoA dioxygenase family)
MNEQAINNYERNGYAIFKSVFATTEINNALESLLFCFNSQLEYLELQKMPSLYDAMKKLHSEDVRRFKDISSNLWRNIDIYNMLHHTKIQEILKFEFGYQKISVAGGQVVHFQSKELTIPGGYFGLPAHQDFPSVNGSLDGVIVWIPFLENTNNEFPLQVIPGSHKNGVYATIDSGNKPWEIRPELYLDNEFVSINCELGDVVVMSTFTVHRSGQEGGDGLKLACSSRFDNLGDPSFVQNSLPSAYLRSVDREQFKKNPIVSMYKG